MAKSKANTTAGARPKASRRESRAPAAATAKAESGAASALPGRSAAPTKQAAVIGLLQREQGATLADLVDATGWLAHTTRAALTRFAPSGPRARQGQGRDRRDRLSHRRSPSHDAVAQGRVMDRA